MLVLSLFSGLLLGASASPLVKPQETKIQERQSSVPYGTAILSCTVPGTVALTFDDGPYIYTDGVLNQLNAAGIKATFFVNGQNFGNIYDFASVIRRIVNEGHQVASHTWSHADLVTLDAAGIASQMSQLDTAFTNIIGKTPTYMRPPYFSYNNFVLSTLGGLGYHVIRADIDTLDWQYNTPQTIGESVRLFEAGLNSGKSLPLSHDVHPNTASTLVPAMIRAIQARGLRGVTVGECLGDASANWYRGGTTTPPTNPPTGPVSPDSTCGGANGYVCPSGQCCSQWGWCGVTSEYCGAGCNPTFGICT
ncbi:hypothetical protein B0O99DRAFT_623107 [Bisporella sp. PMI_857]|nr:hypothetical protein B0O99DRAFT_623107 [Bisporella sp. PMI_857]